MMGLDARGSLLEEAVFGCQAVGAWHVTWIYALASLFLASPGAMAQMPQAIDLRCPGKGIERIPSSTSGPIMAPMSFVGDVNGDGLDDVADHWKNDCPCGAVVFGSPAQDFTRGVDLNPTFRIRPSSPARVFARRNFFSSVALRQQRDGRFLALMT